MQQNQAFNEVNMKKKKALIKCLLFALSINVLLQFDFVENFFADDSVHAATKIHTLCSTNFNFKKTNSDQNLIILGLMAAVSSNTNQSFDMSMFIATEADQMLIATHILADYSHQITLKYRAKEFSGLSPPVS